MALALKISEASTYELEVRIVYSVVKLGEEDLVGEHNLVSEYLISEEVAAKETSIGVGCVDRLLDCDIGEVTEVVVVLIVLVMGGV